MSWALWIRFIKKLFRRLVNPHLNTIQHVQPLQWRLVAVVAVYMLNNHICGDVLVYSTAMQVVEWRKNMQNPKWWRVVSQHNKDLDENFFNLKKFTYNTKENHSVWVQR